MRIVNVEEEQEIYEFAQRAARAFERDSRVMSYTDGAIEGGEYFAVRWGLGQDCVLVFKIDNDVEPRVYAQMIDKT